MYPTDYVVCFFHVIYFVHYNTLQLLMYEHRNLSEYTERFYVLYICCAGAGFVNGRSRVPTEQIASQTNIVPMFLYTS